MPFSGDDLAAQLKYHWNIESRPLLQNRRPSHLLRHTVRTCGSWRRQSAACRAIHRDMVAARRTNSRALRAAIRACAGDTALFTTTSRRWGWLNQWVSCSLRTLRTNDLTSVLPNLVLVWPSNCGSLTFTEIAARPSDIVPVRLGSLSFSNLRSARRTCSPPTSARCGSPLWCRPRGC